MYWLDVRAPFVIEDDERGIHTEIILTSDTFASAQEWNAFAFTHFHPGLRSELIEGEIRREALTLRLVDERAPLLISTVHLDHARRDPALDHGSDRFSTFFDYCSQ